MAVINILRWVFVAFACPAVLNAFVQSWTDPWENLSGDTSYRLPGVVDPQHYSLYIIPDLGQSKLRFDGRVEIDLIIRNSTNRLILHASDLDINEAKVERLLKLPHPGDLGEIVADQIQIEEKRSDALREFYIIEVDKLLDADQPYRLSLKFSGKIRNDNTGFFRLPYFDKESKKWISVTQFATTYARRAFPCFDEPRYRSTFKLSIAHSNQVHSISNTRLSLKSRPDPSIGNLTWSIFETTPKMAVYTLAWMVSELSSLQNDKGDFASWARPDSLDKLQVSQEVGPRSLEIMEELTGIPYFMDKMDQVALPDLAFSAMENWGLVTYQEKSLFVDETVGAQDTLKVTTTIAHELAHQWMGNLVTPTWWSHVWLSEGFVSFYEYLIVDKIRPDWDIIQKMPVLEMHKAFEKDSTENAPPLNFDVNTPNEIRNHLNVITYSKGSSLLRMLQHVLTEATFEKGVKSYLKAMMLKNVEPNDLIVHLEKAAVEDGTLDNGIMLANVAATWMDQPGYPVVYVQRVYHNNSKSAEISQSRFFSSEPTKETKNLQSWWVPISWAKMSTYETTSTKPSTWIAAGESVLIEDPAMENDDCLIVNLQQTGYYRVNYDSKNWMCLAKMLNGSHERLKESERAMLLGDALTLAQVGQLDYPLALLLTEYLPAERSFAPWATVKKSLNYLSMQMRETPREDMYKTWIQSLVSAAFKERAQTMEQKLTREVVATLACDSGLKECRDEAAELYASWRKGDRIDPSMLQESICVGLEKATVQELTYVLTRLLSSDSDLERSNIISGLACVPDELKRDLIENVVVDNGLRPNEPIKVWDSISDQSTGWDIALTMLKQLKDTIISRYGEDHLLTIFYSLAAKVNSQERYDLIRIFGEEIDTQEAVSAALKIAQENLAWKKRNFLTVVSFISTVIPVNYRLSDAVVPENYALRMIPYLDKKPRFTGDVVITVKAMKKTTLITLHAHKDLEINSTTLRVINAQRQTPITITEVRRDTARDAIEIELDRSLEAQQQYTIHIQFAGKLKDDNMGFYRSSFEIGGETKYIATTHFEATHARKAFPCFDEPRFRATFDISIARLPSQHARSNTQLTDSSPESDNGTLVWDTFATTPKMPTYLVAFVISEYEQVQTAEESINIWVPAGSADDAQVAAEVAPKIMSSLEEYTDIKYPLQKVDLFAIPTFLIGAMENWGLATFKQSSLMYNAKRSTADWEMSASRIIAHELSHFWFGNLVTIKWWSSAWLKEGMASYLESVILDKATGNKFQAMNLFGARRLQSAMATDALESSSALTSAVNSPDEISNHMGTITYSKGASFLRMINNCLGEDTFLRGITMYLDKHAYSSATPEDLAAALDSAAEVSDSLQGVTVRQIFDSWTTKPGYPVVHVYRDYNLGSMFLRQNRFLSHKPLNDSTPSTSWLVPFNYFIRGGEDLPKPKIQFLWPNETTKEVLLDPLADKTYILFNLDQAGFYRVNYDMRNWMLIGNGLGKSEIASPAQRSALIDDAIVLARAQLLDTGMAMHVLEKALPVESSLAPWISARRALRNLKAITRGDDEANKLFPDYLNYLTSNAFLNVGWKEGEADPFEKRVLRDYITQLACDAGNAQCLESAAKEFEIWNTSSNEVDPNVLTATVCYGLKNNKDSHLFVKVFKEFKTTQYESTRRSYLDALGCVQDNELRLELFEAAVKKAGVDPGEVTTLFQSITDHDLEAGVSFILETVYQNYDHIAQNLGAGGAANIVFSLSTDIYNDWHLQLIADLTSKYPSQRMTLALETANTTLKWVQNSLSVIKDWMRTAPFMEQSPTASTSKLSSTLSTDPPNPASISPTEPLTTKPSTPTPTAIQETTLSITLDPIPTSKPTSTLSTDPPNSTSISSTEPLTTKPSTPTSTAIQETTLPITLDPIPTQKPAPSKPYPIPTPPPSIGPYRLPSTLTPEEYVVKIVPYLEGDYHFDGEVVVKFKVNEATRSIVLHSVGLKYDKSNVHVLDLKNNAIQVLGAKFDEKYETADITVDRLLTMGQSYRMRISYKGTLSNDMRGLYKFVSYDDSTGSSVIVATQFSPTFARRMLPCWDEPRYRTPFYVHAGVFENQVVLSNSPATYTSSPDPAIGNRVWVSFAETEEIPTYLLGLVVSDYVPVNNEYSNVTVWARKSLANKGLNAVMATEQLLTYLTSYLDFPHNLEKLSLIAVRDHYFNAMENWGLITFKENTLIYENEVTSAAESNQNFVTTLAHELGHQYFGNIVTIYFWDNAWLKEGFASYFQYFAANVIRSQWALDSQFYSRVVSPALAIDCSENTHPLNNKQMSGSSESILGNMDTISYSKGGSIVRMISHILEADNVFQKGLQNYVKNNAFKLGYPDLLYFWLQKTIDENGAMGVVPSVTKIDEVLRTWVDQPGYPVIYVERHYDSNVVTVSQERFLLHPSRNSLGVWWVPLSYNSRHEYYDGNKQVRDWLSPQEVKLVSIDGAPSDWILFNVGRKDFVRVNYDIKNWLSLTKYLKTYSSLLNVEDRAGLVDDSLALARSGRLDYIIALDLVDYLVNETEPEAWEVARSSFSFLDSVLYGSDLGDLYQKWVWKLLKKITTNIGFRATREEKHRTRLARGIVMEWSCSIGMEYCTEEAIIDWNKWLQDSNSISKDTLAATVCVGVNTGTVGLTTVVANFLTQTDTVVRNSILRGIGCSSNAEQQNMILGFTTEESGLRRGEAGTIFKAISSHGVKSVTAALEFIVKNQASMIKASGISQIVSIITMLADRVSTKEQLYTLKSIVEAVDSNSKALKEAIALAERNTKWRDLNAYSVESILTYLVNNLTSPEPSTTSSPATKTTRQPRPPTYSPGTSPDITASPSTSPSPPQLDIPLLFWIVLTAIGTAAAVTTGALLYIKCCMSTRRWERRY